MKTRSGFDRIKVYLGNRWSREDLPGQPARFQINLAIRDLMVFAGLPLISVILFKACETAVSAGPRARPTSASRAKIDPNNSRTQILNFATVEQSGPFSGIAHRAVGTIVRVKLLNTVELLSTAPVQAQILDSGLGAPFIGGTLIGDATADMNINRIKIDFHFVQYPRRPDLAVPLQARALNLDGTFGLPADKKEGLFARAVIRSSNGANPTESDSQDLSHMIARALATGLIQELSAEGQVTNNQGQMLTLLPMTEFFVELTGNFPGQTQ